MLISNHVTSLHLNPESHDLKLQRLENPKSPLKAFRFITYMKPTQRPIQ